MSLCIQSDQSPFALHRYVPTIQSEIERAMSLLGSKELHQNTSCKVAIRLRSVIYLLQLSLVVLRTVNLS